MGLLDFLAANADDDFPSGGLMKLAQPVSGVLAPPQASVRPPQQNWLTALGALSAAMKDAGAFLQHQPQAATNVANFLRQQNGAPPASPTLSGLPPNILAAALLNAARRRAAQMPTGPVAPQPVNNPPAEPVLQPPQGIDPLIWQHMTPEERALWQV